MLVVSFCFSDRFLAATVGSGSESAEDGILQAFHDSGGSKDLKHTVYRASWAPCEFTSNLPLLVMCRSGLTDCL